MKLLILAVLAVGLLSGCATTDREAEQAYYAAMQAQMSQPRQPLFELTAQEGVPITGIDSIRVFSPDDQPQIRPYQAQHHPGWSIAGNVLQTTLPIFAMGWSSYKLADVVGSQVGRVARDVTVVEQPAPTIVEQPAPITAPDPVVVPPTDPVIVPSPDPIVVQPVPAPDPIIVPTPDPVIIPSPDPIIVNQPVVQP